MNLTECLCHHVILCSLLQNLMQNVGLCDKMSVDVMSGQHEHIFVILMTASTGICACVPSKTNVVKVCVTFFTVAAFTSAGFMYFL